MKTRIDKKAFLALISAVMPAISKRDGITSAIWLGVDESGWLTAIATNFDIVIKAIAESDSSESGAVALPATTLAKAVAALPDGGTVLLASIDGQAGASLDCGRAHFELTGFHAHEFPEDTLIGIESLDSVELPHRALVVGLTATAKFASTDAQRPAVTFVLMQGGRNGELQMAATDGHRMGTYTDNDAKMPKGKWMLSAAVCEALAAMLDVCSDAPQLTMLDDGRTLAITVGRVTVKQRMSDDTFPDYQRIIPDRNDSIAMSVHRDQTIAVARRCISMGDSKTTLLIDVTSEGLEFEVETAAKGKAHDSVELSPLFSRQKRTKTRIGIDSRYLIEALSTFKAEFVQIQIADQFSPVLITCEEIPGLIHVCMPHRLT